MQHASISQSSSRSITARRELLLAVVGVLAALRTLAVVHVFISSTWRWYALRKAVFTLGPALSVAVLLVAVAQGGHTREPAFHGGTKQVGWREPACCAVGD